MKKLLLSLGTVAMMLPMVSCNSTANTSATPEEKAFGDSVSATFGKLQGTGISRELKNIPDGKNFDKNSIVKGVMHVLDTDTADKGYIAGLSIGISIQNAIMQFSENAPIDKNLLMSEFKTALMQDSASDVEMQQINAQFQALYQQLQQRAIRKMEEEKAKSPEAVQNKITGESFIKNKKAENPKIITTESGLSYEIITEGTGEKVKDGDVASVKYVGKLIDGTEFDNSNGEARNFRVNQVVPGFSEGLKLMNKGSKVILYIPGELGYGVNGMPQAGIGPNSTLVFEVELVDINPETK